MGENQWYAHGYETLAKRSKLLAKWLLSLLSELTGFRWNIWNREIIFQDTSVYKGTGEIQYWINAWLPHIYSSCLYWNNDWNTSVSSVHAFQHIQPICRAISSKETKERFEDFSEQILEDWSISNHTVLRDTTQKIFSQFRKPSRLEREPVNFEHKPEVYRTET